jgi:hypothetical protein
MSEERRQHVVAGSEAPEDTRDLKRASHAAPAELVRRQPCNVLAHEVDLARVVGKVAAQEIEERGLAGAVRTDDRATVSCRHGQVHAIDGLHAAEMLLEPGDLKDEGPVGRPGRGLLRGIYPRLDDRAHIRLAKRPTKPCGSATMTAMTTAPRKRGQ